jgi:hypothetical protein
MGILGFLFGALIVIVIRGLQGLDPLWAAGPGIVMTAFTTAGFFVWGMGAFDPKMSVHGEAAHAEAEAVEEPEAPRSLLFGSVWQIVTLLIVLTVVLGGFAALPGGLALTQTIQPGASLTMVGYVPVQLPFGGPEVLVSTLVIFVVFVIWAFISLVAAAGAIGFLLMFIARGINETQTVGGGTATLPAPSRQEPSAPSTPRQTLVTFALFIGGLLVLYLLLNGFIGLVVPQLQIPLVSLILDEPTQIGFIALVVTIVILWVAFGRERFMMVIPFVVVFAILYVVFYNVAIGLILPNPSIPPLSFFFDPKTQLVILSAVNAALFTVIILRPQLVLNLIGRFARWLARVLRGVPKFLQ